MDNLSHRFSIRPLVSCIGLFLFLAIFVRWQLTPIEALDETAPLDRFSAERAYTVLETLTKEQVPHFVDSPANRVVGNRIIHLLREMGYQEEIQEDTICRDSSRGLVRCTRVRNIIVHIAGTTQGQGILLSAHYDSVPAGPGGSDAGAAVGTLLETARLLANQPRPKNSIVLLFNEGEEFGLFGAKLFINKHSLASDLKLAINIEARGSGGQSVMFETGEDSGWLVKHYAESTPAPLSSSLFYEVYKYLPNDTDLTVYKEAGLQGLNFAHAEREPHYHTPLDNLNNLDKGSLQHHGDNVWGVVKSIKDIDIKDVESGNLVYTDVLGSLVIHWDEANSLWISIGLLILMIVVYLQMKKSDELQIKQVLKSVLNFILILFASGLVAYGILKAVQIISNSAEPWRANLLPMQIALWSGVAVVGLMVAKWMNKKVSPASSAIGLVSIWLLFAVTTSVVMPGISFLFIIPAMIGVVVLLVMSHVNRTWYASIFGLMAIVAAISFMPIAYVLEIMVSYKMAIAIGIILSFIVSALLPLICLEQETKKEFNLLIYALIATMLVGVGWTSWQPTYTAWMPQALNINYLQKDDEAFVLAGSERNTLPDSLVTALGDVQLETKIPWLKSRQYFATTNSLNISQTTLEVLKNEPIESGRRMTIKLATEETDLVEVKLYIPIDAGLLTIESFGQEYSYLDEESYFNGYYEYRCRGVSCSDLELSLNFASNKAVKIYVARYTAGLPTPIQGIAEQRGEIAVQRQQGDQSIVISEFEL